MMHLIEFKNELGETWERLTGGTFEKIISDCIEINENIAETTKIDQIVKIKFIDSPLLKDKSSLVYLF